MKFNKFIIIFSFTIIFTSCNEDFLDLYPQDAISSNDYWKTTNDLKLYVNQFYTRFPDWGGWSGGIFWTDDNSDNLIARAVNTVLEGTRTVPSSGGGWSYSDIRSVNYFLENYSTVEADLDEYKHYLGEAYFFRAYFYFNLLNRYGGVPIIDKTMDLSSEQLYAPRNSRNEVADFIISDLDKAIDNMNSGPNSNGNRLNKEVAMLLKSRISLYEGTWEKYHENTPFGVSGSNGNKYLQMAATTANDLMTSEIYSISIPESQKWGYYRNFNQQDFSSNSDIMLWKDYDFGLSLTHNAQRYLASSGGGRGLTKSLVESYLCIDGKPISTSPLYQGDDSVTMVATNRDPRLGQTMYLRGHAMTVDGSDTTQRFTVSTLDATGESVCTTGYQLFKGSDPDLGQKETSWVGTTGSIVFRYAEALLILAEAKAELGTITQNDLDISINKLRDRVNMPHLSLAAIDNDPNWNFPTLTPIINEVRRERRVELGVEGYRHNDLMRWRAHELFVNKRPLGAKFVQADYPTLVPGESVFLDENGYIDFYQKAMPGGYGFRPERDYLYPIPTNELTLNENLTQNPGWD